MKIISETVNNVHDLSFNAIKTILYNSYTKGISGHFIISKNFISSYDTHLVKMISV